MSENFEITPIEDVNFFVNIKPKARKWKNYPQCALPKDMDEKVVALKNLKIYEDDVILCGFPRSGTTLMQELIWNLVNDFNFEKGKSSILDLRFPLIEGFELVQNFYDGKVFKTFDDLDCPRTLKTHLPVQLLPDEVWTKTPKVIHMSRDVKDVAVSM